MDVSDLKGLFVEVKKRMDGAIEHARREVSGVRTGRASVNILDAVHVDADRRREAHVDGVAGEEGGVAERPAEPGQAPAEGPERVVGVGEELSAEPPSTHRAVGQQQPGQHRPRLVASHRPFLA